jgi:hypothetical protein
MAELKSIFEQIDPDEEAAAVAGAQAELDVGKGVPHEKVREWRLKLARGDTPPPVALRDIRHIDPDRRAAIARLRIERLDQRAQRHGTTRSISARNAGRHVILA